jgi:hypothetical protein
VSVITETFDGKVLYRQRKFDEKEETLETGDERRALGPPKIEKSDSPHTSNFFLWRYVSVYSN